MPRPSRGTRLWLRAARRKDGRDEAAVWIIRDDGRQISTGCGADDRAEAERRLAPTSSPNTRPSGANVLYPMPVADVCHIYLLDVVPGKADPTKAGERAERLLAFFGAMDLDEITGAMQGL